MVYTVYKYHVLDSIYNPCYHFLWTQEASHLRCDCVVLAPLLGGWHCGISVIVLPMLSAKF